MGGRCGFAIEELARRHGDFAIAGAAVAVQLDGDDRVSRCGVGLLGLGSTPRRASAAEQAVVGSGSTTSRRPTSVTSRSVGSTTSRRPAGLGPLPRQGRRHHGGARLGVCHRRGKGATPPCMSYRSGCRSTGAASKRPSNRG
ncbi:CO dehydrogenase flavoC-terminal domain protein [Mycobacterium xenopi 3993]|nr:CO dehydrogenase flavoC-terminal domain protein [Mycobacterium xenopi 3993]